MQKEIIEILKTQGNFFDFQIIGLLIAFYGYGDSAKEFIRDISNKLSFEMIFRESLKDIGIEITFEKYYLINGNYQYFHRFYLKD